MSTFLSALKTKGFVIQKRGEIEVKGKGRMTTYFLERNLGVSEQQIMGLSDLEGGVRQQNSKMSFQSGNQRPGLFAVCQIPLILFLVTLALCPLTWKRGLLISNVQF